MAVWLFGFDLCPPLGGARCIRCSVPPREELCVCQRREGPCEAEALYPEAHCDRNEKAAFADRSLPVHHSYDISTEHNRSSEVKSNTKKKAYVFEVKKNKGIQRVNAVFNFNCWQVKKREKEKTEERKKRKQRNEGKKMKNSKQSLSLFLISS